ncbi:hypothetical protein JHK87_002084 [Glycine soja]|nr:hypothetical protein JHK87_002084 [Glycine soja]
MERKKYKMSVKRKYEKPTPFFSQFLLKASSNISIIASGVLLITPPRRRVFPSIAPDLSLNFLDSSLGFITVNQRPPPNFTH